MTLPHPLAYPRKELGLCQHRFPHFTVAEVIHSIRDPAKKPDQ
jgi:hypothetical protein